MSDQELKRLISKGGGPGVDDTVKALSECRLYILDRVLVTGTGKEQKRKFCGGNSYPKLLLEGELDFGLKDRKRGPFHIQIRKVKLDGWTTIEGDPLATRDSGIHVDLLSDWYDLRTGGRGRGLNFSSRSLVWDVNGNYQWKKK